jgi:small GTP-binding protein
MSRIDLKLVLLGQPAVGKTCLVHRYLSNEFGETKTTLGASFALKQYPVGDRMLNIGIWDTAGQERFDSLSSFYCRKAGSALICYDITSRQSFDDVRKWINKVREEADADCIVVLVGTKLDLVTEEPHLRKVELAEAEAFAKKINADAFETSAKQGTHVGEVFDRIVQRFQERREMEEARRRTQQPAQTYYDTKQQSVNLAAKPAKPSGSKCC